MEQAALSNNAGGPKCTHLSDLVVKWIQLGGGGDKQQLSYSNRSN